MNLITMEMLSMVMTRMFNDNDNNNNGNVVNGDDKVVQ